MDVALQAQILSLRLAVDGQLSAGRDVLQPPSPEARWAPGERMSARVEAALPGGRFHVKVDDLLLEMHLPVGFRPGDDLELEFVTAQPRPSFFLRDVPEPPLRQQVELSASARQLGEILKTVVPERTSVANQAPGPVPIKTPTPLLDAPVPDPGRLAQALAGALGRSGLFYESHQAQWLLGQRPLSDLLSEPQGKLSPGSGAPEDGAGARLERPSTLPTTAAPEARTSNAGATAGLRTEAGDKVATSPVHPQTLPQLRSQLDALDTHQLIWQGQLWPGQNLEWRINGYVEEYPEGEEAQPWFTQLRLRLPRLGELSAELALVGSALRVRLTAPDPEAQALIGRYHDALARSLAAAGIDLVSFNVASDASD
jgi:Flagellar hook-length control protein FliK